MVRGLLERRFEQQDRAVQILALLGQRVAHIVQGLIILGLRATMDSIMARASRLRPRESSTLP